MTTPMTTTAPRAIFDLSMLFTVLPPDSVTGHAAFTRQLHDIVAAAVTLLQLHIVREDPLPRRTDSTLA